MTVSFSAFRGPDSNHSPPVADPWYIYIYILTYHNNSDSNEVQWNEVTIVYRYRRYYCYQTENHAIRTHKVVVDRDPRKLPPCFLYIYNVLVNDKDRYVGRSDNGAIYSLRPFVRVRSRQKPFSKSEKRRSVHVIDVEFN